MTAQYTRESRSWKFGVALFAGIMMVMLGVFQAIRGLAGLFKNDILLKTPNYVFAFDTTVWGWIHLILGLILILTGFLIVAGRSLGRILGIAIVVVAVAFDFAGLPYYPIWSAISIAVGIFTIWALATYSSEDEVV